MDTNVELHGHHPEIVQRKEYPDAWVVIVNYLKGAISITPYGLQEREFQHPVLTQFIYHATRCFQGVNFHV